METRTFTHRRRRSGYHLFTGGTALDAAGPARPSGVIVRLHGDGNDEYRHPSGLLSSLATVAAERNMILVAPLTPHRRRGCTWWRRLGPNLHWLTALLTEEILPLDGVDPTNIWWYGYSGGAEMISYGILPAAHGLVTGGAVLLGGGGAPDDFDDDGPSPAVRRSLPLTWVVGDRDDGTTSDDGFNALAAARAGSRWYRSRGFDRARLEVVPGRDHYTVPQPAALAAALDSPVP